MHDDIEERLWAEEGQVARNESGRVEAEKEVALVK
jgi:hypothetical protein